MVDSHVHEACWFAILIENLVRVINNPSVPVFLFFYFHFLLRWNVAVLNVAIFYGVVIHVSSKK